MPNGNFNADHDLLTKIDTKVTVMCRDIGEIKNSIGDIYTKIDEQKDKCGDRIEHCSERFTPNRTFRWLFGILVFLMLALGGLATDTNVRVSDNTKQIERLSDKIKEHVEVVEEEIIDE